MNVADQGINAFSRIYIYIYISFSCLIFVVFSMSGNREIYVRGISKHVEKEET